MALTWDQRRFLAQRMMAKSDRDAARMLVPPLNENTPAVWKSTDPEFQTAYEALANDGVDFAKATLRQVLGKGAIEHVGLLTDDDAKIRLGAIRLLYEAQGLLKQQVELSGPGGAPIQTTDLSVVAQLTDEELEVYERLCERVSRPVAPQS